MGEYIVPQIDLDDQAYRSISPKTWKAIAQAKCPVKKNRLLDIVDTQIEAYKRRVALRALKPKKISGKRSRVRKTWLNVRVDPSGFVSLSVKPRPKPEPVLPVSSPHSAPLETEPDSLDLEDGAECTFSQPTSSMGLAVSLSETAPETAPSAIPQRQPRGTRGLSSFGKRLLVGCGRRLQELCGKQNLAFHTATLPVNRPDLIRLTLEKSKEILKYWRKVLSRYLQRKKLDPRNIIICLELQKRGALHLHTVFGTCKTWGGEWITPYEELDALWQQVLEAQVPEVRGAEFAWSCRTEKVKKDVSRYLAKYLSKSISGESPVTEGLSITWYSVGNHLKNWFKENIQSVLVEVENLDFEVLKAIFEQSGVVRSIQLLAVAGYGYRCLFGYCDFPLGFDAVLALLTPI